MEYKNKLTALVNNAVPHISIMSNRQNSRGRLRRGQPCLGSVQADVRTNKQFLQSKKLKP